MKVTHDARLKFFLSLFPSNKVVTLFLGFAFLKASGSILVIENFRELTERYP